MRARTVSRMAGVVDPAPRRATIGVRTQVRALIRPTSNPMTHGVVVMQLRRFTVLAALAALTACAVNRAGANCPS